MRSHPARGAWIEIFGAQYCRNTSVSHPARGAWIEIPGYTARPGVLLSHPARGAWIEMLRRCGGWTVWSGRTPRGVRGLKSRGRRTGESRSCRTPRGVRGLKYRPRGADDEGRGSHPARGAWIEIKCLSNREGQVTTSHPARGAWIEIRAFRSSCGC